MKLGRVAHMGVRTAAIVTLLLAGVTTPAHGAGPSLPLPPTSAPPSGSGSFAVQPSGPNGPGGRDYFIYTLAPGQVYGDVVAVSNLGDKPVTFALYATDALNTKDGAITLLREQDKPVDVGTWVTLGATQYTIDAGKRADIPFKLGVPADASPGDHVGAIVAQVIPDTSTTNKSGIGVDVRLRIGARIYVRVSGPLTPSLTVDKFVVGYDTPANPFGSSSARIDYVVRNTGNVRLSPTATLKLSGIFGWGEKDLAQRQIPELLPGSSLEIAETIHDVQPLIRLAASLKLESPPDRLVVTRSVDRWTVPALGVTMVAVLIAAVVGVLFWRRRRRKAVAGPSGG